MEDAPRCGGDSPLATQSSLSAITASSSNQSRNKTQSVLIDYSLVRLNFITSCTIHKSITFPSIEYNYCIDLLTLESLRFDQNSILPPACVCSAFEWAWPMRSNHHSSRDSTRPIRAADGVAFPEMLFAWRM